MLKFTQARSKMLSSGDLNFDHFTEDEKLLILAVLDRNEKLLQLEQKRIKDLEEHQVKFSRSESIKARTGEWMSEVAKPGFTKRRRATDVVRSSFRRKEKPSMPYYEPTKATAAKEETEKSATTSPIYEGRKHRKIGSSRRKNRQQGSGFSEKQVQFAKENYVYEQSYPVEEDELPEKVVPSIIVNSPEDENKITPSFEDLHKNMVSSFNSTMNQSREEATEDITEDNKTDANGDVVLEDVSAVILEDKISSAVDDDAMLVDDRKKDTISKTDDNDESTSEKSTTPVFHKIKRKGSSRRRKEGPKITDDNNRDLIFKSPHLEDDNKSKEVMEHVSAEKTDTAVNSEENDNSFNILPSLDSDESKKYTTPIDSSPKNTASMSPNLSEDIIKSFDSIIADSKYKMNADIYKEEKSLDNKLPTTTESNPFLNNKKIVCEDVSETVSNPITDDLVVKDKQIDTVHEVIKENINKEFFPSEQLEQTKKDELVDFTTALGADNLDYNSSGHSTPASQYSPTVNVIVSPSSPLYTHPATSKDESLYTKQLQSASEVSDILQQETTLAVIVNDTVQTTLDNTALDVLKKARKDVYVPNEENNLEEDKNEVNDVSQKKKVKKVVKVVKKKVKKKVTEGLEVLDDLVKENKPDEEETSLRMQRRRTAVRKKVVKKKVLDDKHEAPKEED